MSCHSPVKGGEGDVRVMWSFKITSQSSFISWDKLNIIFCTLMRTWVYLSFSFLLYFSRFACSTPFLRTEKFSLYRSGTATAHALRAVNMPSWCSWESVRCWESLWWNIHDVCSSVEVVTQPRGRCDVCLDHMQAHSHRLKIEKKKNFVNLVQFMRLQVMIKKSKVNSTRWKIESMRWKLKLIDKKSHNCEKERWN